MAQETKIVKGGFRATLALLVAIAALILSIVAYTSTGREGELNARIRDLQTSLEKVKQESTKQMDKLRQDTANTLDELSDAVRKKEEPQK